MSIKVDVDKSTKARTEGNTSFKKGHYTTAIIFNPQDGLGYTNRAAAYLKIDKWKDAERDCTTALELAKTAEQPNVKALYRRTLARKSLGDLTGALQDIEEVLSLEPTNETAKDEKVELEEMHVKAAQVREAKTRDRKVLPPSPPRTPRDLPLETAGIEPNSASLSGSTLAEQKERPSPPTARGGSFADLKKDRQAGRKTFSAPTMSATAPTVTTAAPISPSSLPMKDVSLVDPAPAASAPTEIESADISLLDPLAPGSALAFISSLHRHSTSSTLPLIEHLSSRPEALGKMLDNFLEPDQLGLILRRLRETLYLDDEGANREAVRRFVVGLTHTRRWAMTSIMLSKQEKELGRQVWEEAGGEGDWAKRHPL